MDQPVRANSAGRTLEDIGTILVRYGLALTLIWVGFLKFSSYEAEAIQPFAANSPLLSWVYTILSVPTFGLILGSGEIVLGLLIAARPIAPRISALGSLGSAVLFGVTLTFLLTTPGVWQPGLGVPFLSPMPGQFLAKDLTLFAVSIWTAGEALRAADEPRPMA
ncbi:MAG: DUF417 family protein [Chloroflexi bacterium]|nr:DUF417 family protein [Chloroflexota bacterium]